MFIKTISRVSLRTWDLDSIFDIPCTRHNALMCVMRQYNSTRRLKIDLIRE